MCRSNCIFGEQGVVVVEVVAEQRKGFDERAASRHDLGAPAGQKIERGKLLVDPHRIVRAQHRHCRAQADGLGALGGGGQHDGGRGAEKIRPVMLADAEHFEADLIGELDLVHQIAEPLRRRQRLSGGRVRRVLDKRVDADLHGDL
jgi:hypothetical protein